eukprot:jgi/Ulvmu1/4430/UM002_0155.1
MQVSNKGGVTAFLIHSIRTGDDARLQRMKGLTLQRDICAAGGLNTREFLELIEEQLPYVDQVQAEMWYSACCQSSGDVTPYEELLPVLALFEAQFLLKQAVEAGRLQPLECYVIPLP